MIVLVIVLSFVVPSCHLQDRRISHFLVHGITETQQIGKGQRLGVGYLRYEDHTDHEAEDPHE
jgi:hypothetical protein